MGTGEIPARVRPVLLPPRPVARLAPLLPADHTQLRSKEEGSNQEGSNQEGCNQEGCQEDGAPCATGANPDESVILEKESEPLVAPAMAASFSAESEAANALPAVAPKPLESMPRHLIECRVSVVPRLPVVALEKPSSGWPDLTPSPVPRVSLVPPTGRLDRVQPCPSQPYPPEAAPSDAHHWQPSALDSRNLPTVAPRLRSAAPTPAVTMQRLSKPPPERRLVRRLLRDLRSSKREIAFGLGIGIGLSFALGKLGQTYLEHRSAQHAGALVSWTASALPSPEPRVPAAATPAAVDPVAAGIPPSAAAGVPPSAAAGVPPGAAAGVPPSAAAGVPPSAAAGVPPSAAAGIPPSAAVAPAHSPSASQPSARAGSEPIAASSPSRAARALMAAHVPRSTKALRRRPTPSAADLPPIDANPWGEPTEAPSGELESRGKSPLSPSESAGLGHELPL